jgi:hypothetical protein
MNSVELKYPVKIIRNGKEEEIKYLTPSRLKVKHFELLPESLLAKANEKGKLELSKASEKGKLEFSESEMLSLFKDLIPFFAGIFNVPEETMRDVDFEDIESVIEVLEEVFPKDTEKKN